VRGRVDVAGPRWSPDGARLAFVAALDDPDWEGQRRTSVYLIDAMAPRGPPLAA
jgi:Tol biopolymer transport system component